MSLTPDTLTQEEYRKRGYHIVKVEGWGLYPHIHRTDFLGIYDYLAFNDKGEMIAIQTTTKHNANARRKKMLSKKSFANWTRGGRRSMLHGWFKKSGRWALEETELTLKDFEQWQAIEAEKNSHIDTSTELYKELFPNGHEDAAECVPQEEKPL